MRDFFVSFASPDTDWAEWIAWTLENAGYSVFFQKWDSRGAVYEWMNRAHVSSRRTLAVISDAFFHSKHAREEMTARLHQQELARDEVLPMG
jgi:hypothetical protein